eukprot:TRINITY_DN1537_c0_g1_i8.p1 TRINITY_DN1537_c0_g1~~TRINITY_DN1537_c0_g1_i8.p1  ORF type:complete len:231 (-),score=48.59 TRINITY_DN1537_c0_g1_i8:114-806(-)
MHCCRAPSQASCWRLVLKHSSEGKTAQHFLGGPDEVEQLRREAHDALLEGAESGKLLEVLKQGSKHNQVEKEDVERLRVCAREALLKSIHSGRLEELAKKCALGSGEAKAAEQLRQQARDALLDGAKSGKLIEVLMQRPGGGAQNRRLESLTRSSSCGSRPEMHCCKAPSTTGKNNDASLSSADAHISAAQFAGRGDGALESREAVFGASPQRARRRERAAPDIIEVSRS